MDPEGYERQINRLERLRAERDNEQMQSSLDALRDACANDKNVMPYLVDCAKAYATLGEITDVMREAFGIYREPVHI
jgi:methylmalonyl-CoA mutase N-terminal domain/subunit